MRSFRNDEMRTKTEIWLSNKQKYITGGWILGQNPYKSLKRFLPCYSQSSLQYCLRFLFVQTHATSYSFYSSLLYNVKKKWGKPDRKPHPLPYGLRNPKKNLKSENSQDYAQKPQWHCTFMNSASAHTIRFSTSLYGICPKEFHKFVLLLLINKAYNIMCLLRHDLHEKNIWQETNLTEISFIQFYRMKLHTKKIVKKFSKKCWCRFWKLIFHAVNYLLLW
jgi:hypothetical protein